MFPKEKTVLPECSLRLDYANTMRILGVRLGGPDGAQQGKKLRELKQRKRTCGMANEDDLMLLFSYVLIGFTWFDLI